MPSRRSQRDAENPAQRSDVDHYERLGVDPDASAEAIRRAFRALARQLHPDVNRRPDAAARFAEIQSAYEVLIDPERRRAYDGELQAASRRAQRQETAGQGHYTWTNVASRGQTVAGPRHDEVEEFWDTFFARRAGETGPGPGPA